MKLSKIIALVGIAAVTALSAGAQKVNQPAEQRHVDYKYVNTVNPDASARKTAKGIIIAGKGNEMRAFEPFSGTATSCNNYVDVANLYKRTFGEGVNVYFMPIPGAVAYYLPNAGKGWSRDLPTTINGAFAHLSDSVYAVDVYTTLGEHAHEHIYSRTDHHWAPLGGFYAARALAKVAGVPFRELDSYDSVTVTPYVGTMPMFSGDQSIKNYPEDFIYYVPRDIDYQTTYINYTMKNNKYIVGEKGPLQGPFFYNFKGVSTYCTFMGGDAKIVKVETGTHNGRHILLIKDSYGNALPGYLFYSFEEIHVVDSRYFNRNMKQYVADNNITDIVLCNHITLMGTAHICNNIKKYLTQ